ncbi:MAG: tetratricopeptide repeat protein, partial [Planctomycetota bacterium]
MTKRFFYAITLLMLLTMIGCQPSQNNGMSTQGNSSAVQMEDAFEPDRPPTPKTMYVMSDILITQGREAQAEGLLKKILVEEPTYFAAYNSLAELQMRNRRIPEAIQTLSAGLKVNPNDPVLLNNLGMCW